MAHRNGKSGVEAEVSAVRPGALSALLRQMLAGAVPSPGARWAEALKPGAVIGRFELIREIGRGGFGVVYEAKDRELGRVVAFKAVLPSGRAVGSDDRLLVEAEAAARLSHPNIVTLYDIGRTEFGPYLILELLRGKTLARRLQFGPIPLREALRIGVEVAQGLAHAHAHGVVHRDLTPGNIFVCEDGRVKVLDLGMAHAFGRRKLDGGTPGYMAPEQWSGAPEDERTDVFTLGVLLYRMLTNELPFPDDGGRSVQGPRAAPSLEVPEEPGLGELVGRMLQKNPVRRPRDAGEVLVGLRSFHEELQRSGSAPSPSSVRVAAAKLASTGPFHHPRGRLGVSARGLVCASRVAHPLGPRGGAAAGCRLRREGAVLGGVRRREQRGGRDSSRAQVAQAVARAVAARQDREHAGWRGCLREGILRAR